MDREAMESEDPDEEVSELEMLLTALRYGPQTLPRTATRRELEMLLDSLDGLEPSALPSAAARPYPPPASAPVGAPAPGLEGLIAAVDNVDQAQTPEARRSQEQEPEFESVMPTPPSIDQVPVGILGLDPGLECTDPVPPCDFSSSE